MVDRVCARCGKSGNAYNIHVHHKDWNPQNNILENLIYLCNPCHLSWHRGLWEYEDCGLGGVCLTDYPKDCCTYDKKEGYVGVFRVRKQSKNEQIIHVPSAAHGDYKLYIEDGKMLFVPVGKAA